MKVESIAFIDEVSFDDLADWARGEGVEIPGDSQFSINRDGNRLEVGHRVPIWLFEAFTRETRLPRERWHVRPSYVVVAPANAAA